MMIAFLEATHYKFFLQVHIQKKWAQNEPQQQYVFYSMEQGHNALGAGSGRILDVV